jgi:H+/gluconate symporter-like permease
MPDMDYFSKELTQIFHSSPPIFLCVAIIALGYAIKLIPSIPNRIIPMVTYSVAIVAYPIISVPNPGSLPQNYSTVAGIVRDMLGGVIIASIAWIAHLVVLKKLIDKYMPVNDRGDTKFMTKPPEEPKP